MQFEEDTFWLTFYSLYFYGTILSLNWVLPGI